MTLSKGDYFKLNTPDHGHLQFKVTSFLPGKFGTRAVCIDQHKRTHLFTQNDLNVFGPRLKKLLYKTEFFRDANDVNSDPSELAEREHDLGIDAGDWTANVEAARAEQAARYAANSF